MITEQRIAKIARTVGKVVSQLKRDGEHVLANLVCERAMDAIAQMRAAAKVPA